MSEELIQLFDSIALDHPASLLRARKRLTKLLSELRVKIWGSGLTIVAEYGVGYRLDTQS